MEGGAAKRTHYAYEHAAYAIRKAGRRKADVMKILVKAFTVILEQVQEDVEDLLLESTRTEDMEQWADLYGDGEGAREPLRHAAVPGLSEEGDEDIFLAGFQRQEELLNVIEGHMGSVTKRAVPSVRPPFE